MDRQLQIILKLQDQASSELRNVLASLTGIQAQTEGVANSFDAASRSVLALASSYLSFRTIYQGLSLGLQVAADLQTAQIGIQTLTGSAKDAEETIARIKTEAMRTPFTINGLASAVQLITAVTHDGGKATDIVLSVGEALAALGRGQPELDRVIVNLQQVAAMGWAQTIDIKQFAYAGIPIYDMIAKETGLAKDQLADFIKFHGVTFDMLVDMFNKAHQAGGQFFNAYNNQLGTFNQALSNFKDSIGITLANVVKNSGLFDTLTKAMLDFSNVVQAYPQLAQGAMILVGALAALVGVMASIGIIAPIVAAGFAAMTGPIGLIVMTFAAAGIAAFAFRDNLAAFANQIEAHTGIVEAFRQAWDTIRLSFTTQLEPALQRLAVALQPLMPYLTQLAAIVGGAFVLAWVAAVKQLASFITTAAQMIALLTQASAWIISTLVPSINAIGGAIQAVTDKVTALINAFSKLSGIKASALSGIGLGGIANGVIGAIGLPAFASGGIVTGPTVGLVGEAGPEAIIPLSQMGRMGGVTVNVYGDVSGRELVDKIKEQLMITLGANARFAL